MGVKAAPGSTSPAESGTDPVKAFTREHPGAVEAVAIGAAIGAGLGLGIGLGLPGRGASYRAAVTLLILLGFALAGALVAAAIVIRPPRRTTHAKRPGWQKRVDAKVKEGTSSPVPRRATNRGKGSSG
jgi:uncharacterized protein (DUF58 family)